MVSDDLYLHSALASRGPLTLSKDSDEAPPLTSFTRGANLRIVRIEVEGGDAVRLKRLGICEGRCIQLVQNGDPLVVCSVGSRIGISRRLAARIYVRLE